MARTKEHIAPRVIENPREMRAISEAIRRDGRTIAFVPTMGYLHDGHRALLAEARKRGDVLVMSVFVNPTQFAPTEDLKDYPRDFARDAIMAGEEGVDIIFHPSPEAMYPTGFLTEVRVREMSGVLCGVSRPTHFAGVATVVCKLFNVVRPHIAVFGEKDYQQLQVIRRMVEDLDMDVEIKAWPTVREADGLAMSSRNVYLSAEERTQATALFRALRAAGDCVDSGERNANAILNLVRGVLDEATRGTLDYAELRRLPNLEPAGDRIVGPTLLALAMKFGRARLIDNIVLLRDEPKG
ncbi:pantoate--beta-alanine ligase [bacterium]|nr:pantoate--beta-alanine ligase [bacterium]